MIGAALFVAIMFGYFVAVPWAVQPSENLQYFASFNLYVTLDTLLTVKFVLLVYAARAPRWRRMFRPHGRGDAVMAVGDLLEGLGFAEILQTVVGDEDRRHLVGSSFLLWRDDSDVYGSAADRGRGRRGRRRGFRACSRSTPSRCRWFIWACICSDISILRPALGRACVLLGLSSRPSACCSRSDSNARWPRSARI